VGIYVKAVLAAVILGGVFGSATATVVSIDDEVMVVDIRVEVSDAAESVIAHLSFDEEPELVLPMLEREPGVFGLRTELEPKNYVVVFETVGEGGESSGPTTLTRMGADVIPRSGATTTTADEEGLSDETRGQLWLAVALAAGSLSLLAFWVLGSRDDEDEGSAAPNLDEEE